MRWQGRLIYVSEALVDQWVGLEPSSDGAWKVYFMRQELGQVDQSRSRVQLLKKSAQDPQPNNK